MVWRKKETSGGKFRAQKFRNLKCKIADHLNTDKLNRNVEKAKGLEEIQHREESRNKMGMTLGQTVYDDLYHGRPMDHFSERLAMMTISLGHIYLSDCITINRIIFIGLRF